MFDLRLQSHRRFLLGMETPRPGSDSLRLIGDDIQHREHVANPPRHPPPQAFLVHEIAEAK